MDTNEEENFDRQLFFKIFNFFQERSGESCKNNADELFPNIFVGNEFFATDIEEVKTNGITHVLNLAIEDVQTGNEFYKEIGAKYHDVFAEDDPTFDLKQCFQETSVIIENAINEGGKILVHCVAGYRRSPSVAIAFMMMKRNMRLYDAVVEARSNRKIFPNEGFIEQLCMLERELYG